MPEKHLRNHERLAAISTVEVAQIAATLLRDGGDEIEAIRKAYTLLDIAEHCNLFLKTEASVEAGIKRYREGVKIDDEFYAAFITSTRSAQTEKSCPCQFDEGLAIVIPLPNATKTKADVRMTRFKRFVIQRLRETYPEQDEQERLIKAGELVEGMKRDGIDARFFGQAAVIFPGWWEATYKLDQSAKGKRGQAVKKGKQGRVKSESDKRKGARPPWKKLRAIIEAA